jgi:hypothetical protein
MGAEDRLGANEPKNQGKNVARFSHGFFSALGDAKRSAGIYFFGRRLRKTRRDFRADFENWPPTTALLNAVFRPDRPTSPTCCRRHAKQAVLVS